MSKTRLRNHASDLLDASKKALRYFLRQPMLEDPSEEAERREVMSALRLAIDLADPPKDIPRVSCTLTHKSYEVLTTLVAKTADENLIFFLEDSARVTKQRIYLDLALNHGMLRKLKYLLEHKAPSAQRDAFRRVAEQIEERGLSLNSMEILAESGL